MRKNPARKIQQANAQTAGNVPVYVDVPQLLTRYGGRSHMWLERLLKRDKTFPRPFKIGRLRFFRLDAIEAWERETATRAA